VDGRPPRGRPGPGPAGGPVGAGAAVAELGLLVVAGLVFLALFFALFFRLLLLFLADVNCAKENKSSG
jgi:hypothetical protein